MSAKVERAMKIIRKVLSVIAFLFAAMLFWISLNLDEEFIMITVANAFFKHPLASKVKDRLNDSTPPPAEKTRPLFEWNGTKFYIGFDDDLNWQWVIEEGG